MMDMNDPFLTTNGMDEYHVLGYAFPKGAGDHILSSGTAPQNWLRGWR